MLYSCTHMAAVGVEGLILTQQKTVKMPSWCTLARCLNSAGPMASQQPLNTIVTAVWLITRLPV